MTESLTSPQVIAALISGAFAIVCTLIKFLQKGPARDEPKSNPARTIPSTKPVQCVEPSPTNSQLVISRVALGHKQIAAAIDAVPPFQRDGVHQTFVGGQVSWLARLGSFSRIGKGISASVSLVEDNALIFCDAKPEDCVGLECAPEGTLVTVVGQIKMMSTYEGVLENCKITVADPDENP